MKKRSFMLNAFFLTSATLIARVIGIAFRVYMSNKIGSEGIGLYQLISTIYMFAATFATSGISLAVTRLVTDSIAKKEYRTAKIAISRCFYIGVVLSSIVGIVMFVYSEALSVYILHDTRAILSLKILAPSLPFMSISACFRGYFFAVRQVIKTASEQLFEQIIEILIFSCLIGFFLPKGIEYACCSVVIGTTVAEILSCFYSYFIYKKDVLECNNFEISNKREIYKKIAFIALPVTASSSLRSGLSTVENILIPAGLQRSGESSQKSLAGYGLISGMVMPVITFPSVFLFSFALLLIPEMSEANAVNHKRNINYIVTRVFYITLIYSIMISGIFLFFSNDFGLSIYGSSESGALMSILAPLIPLMYLDGVVDAILKGLNEQLHYLSYNIIDSILRVIFIFVLLPIYGLKGLIIVIFFSTILNSFLSMNRLIKVTELKVKIIDWLLKPVAAIVVSCFALNAIFSYEIFEFSSITYKLILEILLAILFYIFILFISGSINNEEFNWIKSYFKRDKISIQKKIVS